MVLRRDRCTESSLRLLRAGLVALWALPVAMTPAIAQSAPSAGFFERVPEAGGQAQIEADMLAYDGRLDVISAKGHVLMYYEGFELHADSLNYNQGTGELVASGHVRMRDPAGSRYSMDNVRVTGGMKEAFVESLTLTTSDGSLVRARDVHYSKTLATILTEAHYSPCGLCIDEKGRRIGWKVNAGKLTYDRDNALVYLEGPSLEVLGVPVAWAPWLVVPDPSQPRAQGFRTPDFDYTEQYGARLDVPFFVPINDDMDLLLTPTLMSRQGGMLSAQFTHRLETGEYDIWAAGLYQLDPAAFTFVDAQREWRGSIQTTGKFTPLEDWTVGWSYTAFTDAAFLVDYEMYTSKNVINEVYATYLTRDLYLDTRLQQFNLMGNYTKLQQDEHARAIPSIKAASYHDLGEMGRVDFSARVLGIQRGRDSTASYGGVPYVFAYEENKQHVMIEGAWQNQYILPMGVVATPYLGMRLDAANYERTGAALPLPYPTLASPISLLTATPIAAMDFRWPLMAMNSDDTHLFEPIAQVVYRGSDTTLPGITNDDAQGFVFDDTNLFSYNRFSGSDRQETGLRVNLGARYLANFDDGTWLQLIGGQSFHLAGVNGMGVVDPTQTGNSTGLEDNASYVVLGAQGSPAGGLSLGAKTQIDPDGFAIRRATAAATLALEGYALGSSYTYLAANPAIGIVDDQHEVTGTVSGPLPFDYWSANASLSWDLAQNQWLETTGGITYDDGYFVAGAFGTLTGDTHTSPNALTLGFKIRLRSPAGEYGF